MLSKVLDLPESSERTEGSMQAPVSVRQTFYNRPSTTQTRAAEYRQWVVKSPKAYIRPRKGKPRELPRFSRFQQEVQRRTALEWGLDYPYVPSNIMDVIEDNVMWEDDMVWEYMRVPKSLRGPHCKQTGT